MHPMPPCTILHQTISPVGFRTMPSIVPFTPGSPLVRPVLSPDWTDWTVGNTDYVSVLTSPPGLSRRWGWHVVITAASPPTRERKVRDKSSRPLRVPDALALGGYAGVQSLYTAFLLPLLTLHTTNQHATPAKNPAWDAG